MKRKPYVFTVGEPREIRQFKCPVKIGKRVVRWAVADTAEEAVNKANSFAYSEAIGLSRLGIEADYERRKK